uniref:Developmentally regulated GTP binding protein 2 n=1 Tax=Ficedula albicollis TaxID=59894 RepID=A0A803VEK6_FICAL
MKSGDARVALIGFPSVGKSTFLSLMTSTASEAASYEFTTLTCIPGVIEYKGANIQLLDLPGIIEGAAQGKGRGRQVIAVARTADVVIMMLDATKGEVQRALLEKELESVGIRLNKSKPNIYFKPKKGGGISFNSTVTLTQCSEKLVQLILHEYKIFNAEVLFREDCSPDEFIDVIVGNRVYMPCLYVSILGSLAAVTSSIFSVPKKMLGLHRIMEQFGLGGTLKLISFHPCHGRDTFQYPRLLQALSSLVLDTSRDGAATASLGMTVSTSEIFNAEVLFREDCSPDEFIDVIVGNRVYMPCLYVSILGSLAAVTSSIFSVPKKMLGLHRIMEQFGLGGTLKLISFHPCHGRDTFHYPRLLQALSSLVLDTSRDGAATVSLGSLCQGLLALTGKHFFSKIPSNPALSI